MSKKPLIIQSGIPDLEIKPLQVTQLTGYGRDKIAKLCEDGTFVSRRDPLTGFTKISFFSVREHMEQVNRAQYAETERRKKIAVRKALKERGK